MGGWKDTKPVSHLQFYSVQPCPNSSHMQSSCIIRHRHHLRHIVSGVLYGRFFVVYYDLDFASNSGIALVACCCNTQSGRRSLPQYVMLTARTGRCPLDRELRACLAVKHRRP